MVGVDVHVGDPFEAVIAHGHLDGDADVAEDAETGGPVPRGVMQPADGDEGAGYVALHNGRQRLERAADGARRSLVDAGEGGGVAGVQIAMAQFRELPDPVNIGRGVEALDLITARQARRPLHRLRRVR